MDRKFERAGELHRDGEGVREQIGRIGIATVAMKPDEFAKFVRERMGIFRKIARELNIPQQ